MPRKKSRNQMFNTNEDELALTYAYYFIDSRIAILDNLGKLLVAKSIKKTFKNLGKDNWKDYIAQRLKRR